MTALEIIRAGTPAPCRPWPRYELGSDAWRAMAAALLQDPGPAFLGLWADTIQVHALLDVGAPVIASAPVEAGLYAALSPARPAATLFERMVADLWGHQAADAIDTRPWLDHGAWPLLRPLSDRPAPNASAPEVPEMTAWPGQTLAWGPLPPLPAAGTGHWRAGIKAGVLTGLEARLGYTHRGVLGLMRGKSPPTAARLAAHIAGTATVAHSTAFARAVEAALGLDIPRATAVREVLLAIERRAMALHDAGAAAERESILAACEAALGHRLMMNLVIPGGVADLDHLPALDGVPPLADLPDGPFAALLPAAAGEGLGQAEGPHGPVWHWTRLAGGVVAACFALDPAWQRLHAFEQAAPGHTVAQLPGLATGLHLAGMEL